MNFLFVALGGAVGSMCRYGISLLAVQGSFPFLTLITNFLGAVAIGFVVAGPQPGTASSADRYALLAKTGFCGGFTTFSTFSLESYTLLKSGKAVTALLYMAASVGVCLAGVAVGWYIGSKLHA